VEDFRTIEELLGWDPDEEVVQQLREARSDRERGNQGSLHRSGLHLMSKIIARSRGPTKTTD